MVSRLGAAGLHEPQAHSSRLSGRIELCAAGIIAVLVVYLAATESLVWVPFVLGALVAIVVLLSRWPDGALVSLLVAASVPRWFVPVSSWNAKPEHMVAAMCAGFLFFRLLAGTNTWRRLEKLDFLLLAFLAVNYFSSYAYSPDPAATLRWSFLQTLAVSPFFLIGQLVTTRERLDRVMTWFLWVGALEACFGILCYFSHVLFGTMIGVTLFFYIGFIPGVHGTLWEPNIFGSYCTCFAVMYLFYYLADKRRNILYMAGFAVTTVALLLSLARQAWACLILVGGWVLLRNLRPSGIHRKKTQWKRLAFSLAGIVVALVVALGVMSDLSDRFSTLSVTDAAEDPTVVRRAGLIALAMQDIQQHPIVGLGSSSFQLLYLGSDDSYQGVGEAWLGSFFFRVVHDTGIIGMFFLGWFFVNLGRRAWRALSVRTSTNTAIGALLAGALVLLIAYQLTDASTLAFMWIHIGLLAAAVRIAEADSAIASGVTQVL
jgi:hypothetical protein